MAQQRASTIHFGRSKLMKRIFDISLSISILIITIIPICLIAIGIKLTSEGPILYWSKRVGKNNKLFRMPKFRTMYITTPTLATHLLENPEKHVTNIGRLLRRTSLDELPQCLSILKGDMSFVGPRPALYNQGDLIELRNKRGIDRLIPGLTGWAQINGRDELSVLEKVELDHYYLKNQTFLFDVKILVLTVFKVILSDNIAH